MTQLFPDLDLWERRQEGPVPVAPCFESSPGLGIPPIDLANAVIVNHSADGNDRTGFSHRSQWRRFWNGRNRDIWQNGAPAAQDDDLMGWKLENRGGLDRHRWHFFWRLRRGELDLGNRQNGIGSFLSCGSRTKKCYHTDARASQLVDGKWTNGESLWEEDHKLFELVHDDLIAVSPTRSRLYGAFIHREFDL